MPHSPVRFPRSATRIGRLVATVTVVGAIALGCSGSHGGTVTVLHPAVPAPTLIANGTETVGDIRVWNFSGTTDAGDTVVVDWVMTTTGFDTPRVGLESRVSTGVFSFADGADQLILQGVASYPSAGSVLDVSSTTIRAIVGGTGKYSGASGHVDSIHLDDDTWQHVFHLD